MARERARIISVSGYTPGNGIHDAVFTNGQIIRQSYYYPYPVPEYKGDLYDSTALYSFLSQEISTKTTFVKMESKDTLVLYCHSIPLNEYNTQHDKLQNGSFDHPFQNLNDALAEAQCLYISTCGMIKIEIKLSGIVDYSVTPISMPDYHELSVIVTGVSDSGIFAFDKQGGVDGCLGVSFRNIKATFNGTVSAPLLEKCEIDLNAYQLEASVAIESVFIGDVNSGYGHFFRVNVAQTCRLYRLQFYKYTFGTSCLFSCIIEDCTWDVSSLYYVISSSVKNGLYASDIFGSGVCFVSSTINISCNTTDTDASATYYVDWHCLYSCTFTYTGNINAQIVLPYVFDSDLNLSVEENYLLCRFDEVSKTTLKIKSYDMGHSVYDTPAISITRLLYDSNVEIQTYGFEYKDGWGAGMREAGLRINLPQRAKDSSISTLFSGVLNRVYFSVGFFDSIEEAYEGVTFTNEIPEIEEFEAHDYHTITYFDCDIDLPGAPIGSGFEINHIVNIPQWDIHDFDDSVSCNLEFSVASVGVVNEHGGSCGSVGTHLEYTQWHSGGACKKSITANRTYEDVVFTDYLDPDRSYTSREPICD